MNTPELEVQVQERLKALKQFASEKKRACPQPSQWNDLYQLLPGTKRGLQPSLPLILAAWSEAPGLLKHLRFFEHLDYAAANGVLDEVEVFLRALREDEWFHFGDK